MKTFGKVILSVVFVILAPLFVFSLALKLSDISASYLKKHLAEKNIYKTIIQDVNKDSEFSISGLTPSYLQKKTEKLIDDTESWLKGKTKEAPNISLIDLDKNTLVQLEALGKELKKEQEKARQMGQESEISTFDFEKFAKSGFTYPIGEQMGFLKQLYFMATWGLLVFGMGMIFSLLGIILLAEAMASRLRSVAFAFLGAGLWLLPGWLAAFFGSQFLTQVLVENSQDIPVSISPLIETLFSPIISKYIQIGGIGFLVFFGGAVALFISARSYSSNK